MKKQIKYIILLVSLIGLGSSSCRENPSYRKIYIKNNSDKAVYFGFSFAYPDTGLQKINQFPGDNGSKALKLNPGAQTYGRAALFAFNPILQLFIFDADVIEHEAKDSIIANYKVLKKYEFDETKLEITGWTITYP